MKKGVVLFIVLFILVVPMVLGDSGLVAPLVASVGDCNFDVSSVDGIQYFCGVGFSPSGKVSVDGHYSADLNNAYPYTLCCDSRLSNGKGFSTKGGVNVDSLRFVGFGAVSFSYAEVNSSVNGSGHVGDVSFIGAPWNYNTQVKLGFPASCSVRTMCASDEICIFKVGDDVVGGTHVAECSSNTIPMDNLFTKNMCCGVAEICNDGVDNDGNGLVDCADPACFLPDGTANVEATYARYLCGSGVNKQSTSDCVQLDRSTIPGKIIKSDSCKSNDGNYYYCSYGDTSSAAPGFCCGAGTYAKQDPDKGWFCQETAECAIKTPSASERICAYDFDSSKDTWLYSKYDGVDTNNWCNSQVPNLRDETEGNSKSAACCLIAKSGNVNYYLDSTNVKIFG